MRKWQGYSVLALALGAVGAACGASQDAASSATSGAASTSVPADNTANLDAVMSDAVTQTYLADANRDARCAADANAVVKIVANLKAVLCDAHGSASGDANSATVVGVFEDDLPGLQNAMDTLQDCVKSRCGNHNMPDMPRFPCGKPGSTTFPHSGNGNATNGNGMCGGHSGGDDDDHHHSNPFNPNANGSTTGSMTTAGTTTGGTTAGTTTAGAGTTTAGTTTAGTTTGGHPNPFNPNGTHGTTTAGTTTAGTTAGAATAGAATAGTTAGAATAGTTTGGTAGTTTAGTTTGGTTTAGTTGTAPAGTTTGSGIPNVSGNSAVLPSSCISVILSGRSFVACNVPGL